MLTQQSSTIYRTTNTIQPWHYHIVWCLFGLKCQNLVRHRLNIGLQFNLEDKKQFGGHPYFCTTCQNIKRRPGIMRQSHERFKHSTNVTRPMVDTVRGHNAVTNLVNHINHDGGSPCWVDTKALSIKQPSKRHKRKQASANTKGKMLHVNMRQLKEATNHVKYEG